VMCKLAGGFGMFLPVKGYFHRKIRVGDTACGSAAILLAPSALLLGDLPVRKASPPPRGQAVKRFSDRPLPHASFADASCFDVIVPGVLRVPIDVIVMNGDLRDVIGDGWGSRPACAVHADRRGMEFGRRPGACEP